MNDGKQRYENAIKIRTVINLRFRRLGKNLAEVTYTVLGSSGLVEIRPGYNACF